jgi:hypothetical protein
VQPEPDTQGVDPSMINPDSLERHGREVERVPFVPNECGPDLSLQGPSREESLPPRNVYVELAT